MPCDVFRRRPSPPVCHPRPPAASCPSPCPPPCPPLRPECGPRWLLPRVIASAREQQRCLPACLTVSGLPCGLCEPVYVTAVEACGEIAVRMLDACLAEAEIPLTVWVCDAAGRNACGAASVRLRCRIAAAGSRGGSLVAQAAVRLVDSGCGCGQRFEVRLAVWLEVYLVRLEPCGARPHDGPPPPPPPKPLYPQPWY